MTRMPWEINFVGEKTLAVETQLLFTPFQIEFGQNNNNKRFEMHRISNLEPEIL